MKSVTECVGKVFAFFSSLQLAVVTLLSLAAVLAVGTVMESFYGMRAAQLLVYSTWWFAGLLLILGLNVLCAALSRFPWKRHQVGFVITHTGILMILFGAWLTQRYGVDGSLPVEQGTENNGVILNDLKLTVLDEEVGSSQQFPVPETGMKSSGKLLSVAIPGEKTLQIREFLPRVKSQTQYVQSSLSGVGRPAIQFKLFNSRLTVEEWLVQQDPQKVQELALGPAVISFQKLWNIEQQTLFLKSGVLEKEKNPPKIGYLVIRYGGKEVRVPVEKGSTDWVAIQELGLELKVLRYLANAVVKNNELVSRDEQPRNPTLQVRLRGPGGSQEKHTVFANFPEFPTRHSRESAGRALTDLTLGFLSTAAERHVPSTGPRGRLLFAQSFDDKHLFYYTEASAGKRVHAGEIEIGKAFETGWMDLKFQVENWLPFSQKENIPYYIDKIATSENQFPSAVRVEVASQQRSPADAFWLFEGQAESLASQGKRYLIRYGREVVDLPFSISLQKFKIGKDPGTEKAASYESQVVVKDPETELSKRALISMNEPLQYGGYTFYQASYQMEEGKPPISIFSVNRDPGRMVKYLGSIVLVLGILVMFYMNPHYFGILLGRGKAA